MKTAARFSSLQTWMHTTQTLTTNLLANPQIFVWAVTQLVKLLKTNPQTLNFWLVQKPLTKLQNVMANKYALTQHIQLKYVNQYIQLVFLELKSIVCSLHKHKTTQQLHIPQTHLVFTQQIVHHLISFVPFNIKSIECAVNNLVTLKQQIAEDWICLVSFIVKAQHAQPEVFNDLMQEGRVALIQTIETFNPCFEKQFKPFATWAVRRRILQYLLHINRPIHMPSYLWNTWNKAVRIAKTQDKHPIQILMATTKIKPNRLKSVMRVAQPCSSLDETTTTTEIQDDLNQKPSEVAIRFQVHNILNNMVHELLPKEVCVMRARFGLESGSAQTLDQVCKRFNISRRRAKQLETQVLKQLRYTAAAEQLQHLLHQGL